MSLKRLLPAICLVAFTFAPVSFAEQTDAEPVSLDTWLMTQAVTVPFTIMDGDTSAPPLQTLLDGHGVDPFEFWPKAGTTLNPAPGKTQTFQETTELTFAPLPDAGSGALHLAYAATYLQSDRWHEAGVEVTGQAAFKLYLDGEEILARTSAADSDTAAASAEAVIDRGHRRLLLITAVSGDDSLAAWSFKVTVTPKNPTDAQVATSTDPKHRFNFYDYYRQELAPDLDVSPDGRWLAATRGYRNRENDATTRWLEIWDLDEKELVWEYRSSKNISGTAWSPDSKTLLLVLPGADKGRDLVLWDTETQLLTPLSTSLEKAGGFTWSPDGQGIYYTVRESYEEGDQPYKVMWDLPDRWGGWRDDAGIWYMGLEGDTHVKLTEGKYTPDNWLLSPDGKELLVISWKPSPERPFYTADFWLISTETGASEKIYQSQLVSIEHPCWSPDGRQVAFSAPLNPVPGNDSPYPDNNDNQTSLWILDTETGEAENKTPDFEPTVAKGAYGVGWGGTLKWHDNETIVFTGLYNKVMRWYVYYPDSGEMEVHDFPTPGANELDCSTDKKSTLAVFWGKRVEDYGDVYWYDWKRKRSGKLFPMGEKMKGLVLFENKVEDYDVTYWDHVEQDSVTVPGYLYYPADYDPEKSYPVITDFYGGVAGYADGWVWGSQVLATRGYFVYVPSPRGAAGWGQEFADHHPNDWGIKTSRDMNNGLRHIVENVPGADPERCAPVSGSYGGFMTMYMLAMDHNSPDYYPYATGISDYGISNLASYWGIGWWGYLYSDMATARTYPWSDPQYYIDHSPLFFADRITAPLLLLHGDADVNVPVGESDQMYTALKALDKEVEFIRFPGEDHGMASTRTKYLTSKRLHVEWFDRWLKDQPGAWDKRMEDEHQR